MSGRILGVVPVLATPFSSDGTVDFDSLRTLTEFQLASRIGGIALFGMASEAFTLTRDERRAVLDTVVAIVDDAVPLVLGVSATSPSTAVEAMHDIDDGRSHVYMVMPPSFVRPTPSQLEDFYLTVADEAAAGGSEIMVQDAEGSTGVPIPPDAIARLAIHPAVTSVKVESAPTVPKMVAVLEAARHGRASIDVLGGQNAQFLLDEFAVGSVGSMPACEYTDVLCRIADSWREGDTMAARVQHAELLPLLDLGLQRGFAWAVHKEILVMRGLISSAIVRSPAQPLPHALRALVRERHSAFDAARSIA
jgi:2-keto-3-deoxy-L-arabinonate dehydratase